MKNKPKIYFLHIYNGKTLKGLAKLYEKMHTNMKRKKKPATTSSCLSHLPKGIISECEQIIFFFKELTIPNLDKMKVAIHQYCIRWLWKRSTELNGSCWKSMFIEHVYRHNIMLKRLWGEVKCFVFGGEPYATSPTVNTLKAESGEWLRGTVDIWSNEKGGSVSQPVLPPIFSSVY